MARKVRKKPCTTKVTSKNQVTLPVAALRAAHLGIGDELRVEVQGDGRLVLIRDVDPVEQVVGAFAGLSAAADLEQERDAWT
ncbi:AbrB/MazE/SpoVT family DNA-binding domain-containing protein [Streptomyces armeniacus]|uniref:AbrB/MazE/SpoVT family DNA-binding domain-containing protein n=1 Tax=Streptomyces armeniacus TaxID=83291 RepID=A0A345XR93_9ACTN|nr:AbrB/MazE/SpoVT family DNA-binding domain-containing protein [Streptomyces armeniacus]AXK34159.1 AbrB/MazE/SpoVT family DNA-binding domain-containing protein [Streptomyces armeniacus]